MILNQNIPNTGPTDPKFYAVEINQGTASPTSRCVYPETIIVNGTSVNNACFEFTPASSSENSFNMNSWADTELVKNIKPVKYVGGFIDAPKDASLWETGETYFTVFPFWWLSITKTSNKITIIFSNADTQPDSTFQCFAHTRSCDNCTNEQIETAMPSVSRNMLINYNNDPYFANAFLISCMYLSYTGNSGTMQIGAKVGTTCVNNQVRDYLKYINQYGHAENDIMSLQQWTYLQALFILLYKSTNSQAAHSYGLTKKTGSESLSEVQTNTPLSTTSYGMAGAVDTTQRNAFFWIHDIWGNMYQFVGGAWTIYPKKIYYWLPRLANENAISPPEAYTTNGYTNPPTQEGIGTDTGYTFTSRSSTYFFRSVDVVYHCGLFPTDTSGSSTTYYCDRYQLDSSSSNYAYFCRVGGNITDRDNCGMFYINASLSISTSSTAGMTSRLVYRGGI